jgi:L-amino acid N-acyltransferase YncA
MTPGIRAMQDDQRQENMAKADPAGDAHAVIVRPSCEGDVEAMLAIYRHHIRRGVEDGVEDNGMLQPDDLRDRRKNLRDRRFPHLVATLRGDVIGYAYVVLFRKRPAYRYTVKHSIYIHHAHVGGGVGRLLLGELIDVCAAAGFRQMIGYIDADNATSLALHEKFGFSRVGYLPGVAYRYGRWADSVMVQRSLGLATTAPPPAFASLR